MRVASFPTFDGAPPPYLRLLHDAVGQHGVALVAATRLDSRLALGESRPDVIHVHWVEYLTRPSQRGPDALARATVRTARVVMALRALRRADTAIVWTIHNLRGHEAHYPRLEDAAMRATARLAHKIIVHSEHARRRVAETYGTQTKVEVVPHGNFVDFYPPPRSSREELRAALHLSPDTFAFLVFGQVRRYKRIPETIAAFRALGDEDVALIVAGWAWDADERLAVERAAGDDPRVHLRLEFVPDDEIAELHLIADAAVLGYHEVFSSGALLLALSLGLPTVVPARGSAAELASAPALVPFSEGELTQALGAVRQGDKVERRSAARAAAEAADWDAIGKRTASIYREAMAECAVPVPTSDHAVGSGLQ